MATGIVFKTLDPLALRSAFRQVCLYKFVNLHYQIEHLKFSIHSK
ncbi:hypothetical protein UF75_4518 [Desulfosporosinus sp. I2]|nr:hypothetical protein UF75_4518 [Desulfosporosinus sp. I2]